MFVSDQSLLEEDADLKDEAAWEEAVNGEALKRMVLSSADPSGQPSLRGLGRNRVRHGGSGSPGEEGPKGTREPFTERTCETGDAAHPCLSRGG